MNTKPTDAAFAKAAFYHPDGGVDSPQEGLTKREYFAAMAMQGLASSGNFFLSTELVETSVEIADLLIEALNKQQ